MKRVATTLAAAWLGLAAPLLAQPPPAGAPGGLSISPVRVDLAAQERGRAVTLTNGAGRRRTIQVEVYAWRQPGDDEDYTPTREILANPPLFFLEPGASQVVRIGRAASAPPAGEVERSYRVYFREVLDESAPSTALRMALRIGIPVFLGPAAPAAPSLSWSGVLQRDGSLLLRVRNDGRLHARAADVRVLGASGATVLGRGEAFQYVLPGATRSWRIVPTTRLEPGPARVAAVMEEGSREFPLELRAE